MPDNASIKEALKLFTATFVRQEEEILTLNSTMRQMSLDNKTAHESLISWTLNIVQATQNNLYGRINDCKEQIQNVTYNLQGFADNYDFAQQLENKIKQPTILPPLEVAGAFQGNEYALRINSMFDLYYTIRNEESVF